MSRTVSIARWLVRLSCSCYCHLTLLGSQGWPLPLEWREKVDGRAQYFWRMARYTVDTRGMGIAKIVDVCRILAWCTYTQPHGPAQLHRSTNDTDFNVMLYRVEYGVAKEGSCRKYEYGNLTWLSILGLCTKS